MVDDWVARASTRQAFVFLTDKPHSLRVEYFEEEGGALIRMSWARVDAASQTTPAAVAYYHDVEDERKANLPQKP